MSQNTVYSAVVIEIKNDFVGLKSLKKSLSSYKADSWQFACWNRFWSYCY